MGKIVWPSEEEKWMTIGYLASTDVIASIEATVPLGKTLKFQREFHGKYDPEYPYEANKFGYQFRIYLRNTEGCPTFLYEQLDTQYKNRINDTDFIRELVLEYGFRFSKKRQPDGIIERAVREKGEDVYEAFKKGRYPRESFLHTLIRRMKSDDDLNTPIILDLSTKKTTSKTSKKRKQLVVEEQVQTLPADYLFRLGWIGEAYLDRLLNEKNPSLYKVLNIPFETVKEIIWHNNGWINETYPLLWSDRSVGNGADFVIITNQADYYIEVKSSKRKYPYISMTGNELKKMESEGERYFLVKIDFLERLLSDGSPEIHVYKNPYKFFFTSDKIKAATFITEN